MPTNQSKLAEIKAFTCIHIYIWADLATSFYNPWDTTPPGHITPGQQVALQSSHAVSVPDTINKAEEEAAPSTAPLVDLFTSSFLELSAYFGYVKTNSAHFPLSLFFGGADWVRGQSVGAHSVSTASCHSCDANMLRVGSGGCVRWWELFWFHCNTVRFKNSCTACYSTTPCLRLPLHHLTNVLVCLGTNASVYLYLHPVPCTFLQILQLVLKMYSITNYNNCIITVQY